VTLSDTAFPARYDRIARFLHWLIALAIICMLAAGWIMVRLPNGDAKFNIIQLHKSVGITILLLALFRLGWRLWHKPPALPRAMPGWEKFAATGTHWLLYALMIGMPLLGWIMVSASPLGLPTILYGVIPWPHLPVLPDLPDKGHISHIAGKLHNFFAWVLAILVAGHIAAAWKHHLFNRDDVLTRMAPGFMVSFLQRLRGQK
jgi:cytochrome b561